MYDMPIIRPMGDSALCVEFGNILSETVNVKVKSLFETLKKNQIDGIVEMTPTYCSLLIEYDPLKIKGYSSFAAEILQQTNAHATETSEQVYIYEIPTWYNGPDLETVARHANLSIEEVIRRHAERMYRIYMLGFTPGFPYLGGMDESLATPRLEVPRSRIEAGSVGIAGNQTGIYPMESPGGWQIIGKTPLKLFDVAHNKPTLLSAGNYLKFVPIDEPTYHAISLEIEQFQFNAALWVKEYTKNGND